MPDLACLQCRRRRATKKSCRSGTVEASAPLVGTINVAKVDSDLKFASQFFSLLDGQGVDNRATRSWPYTHSIRWALCPSFIS